VLLEASPGYLSLQSRSSPMVSYFVQSFKFILMIKKFLVQSSAIAKTKAGKSYAKCRVFDEGLVLKDLNVWNVPSAYKAGQVLAFKDTIVQKSPYGLSIPAIYVQVLDISDLTSDHLFHSVKLKSTYTALDVRDTALRLLQDAGFRNEAFEKFLFAQPSYLPYGDYPAALRNHHTFKCGLSQHTNEMLLMAESLFPLIEVFRDEQPFDRVIVILTILFHDYGKIREYTPNIDTISRSTDYFKLGHPFLSAEFAGGVLRICGVEEAIVLRVQHCILAHHGRKEWGSPVEPDTAEAWFIHLLDMLSSRLLTPSITTIFNSNNYDKYNKNTDW